MRVRVRVRVRVRRVRVRVRVHVRCACACACACALCVCGQARGGTPRPPEMHAPVCLGLGRMRTDIGTPPRRSASQQPGHLSLRLAFPTRAARCLPVSRRGPSTLPLQTAASHCCAINCVTVIAVAVYGCRDSYGWFALLYGPCASIWLAAVVLRLARVFAT